MSTNTALLGIPQKLFDEFREGEACVTKDGITKAKLRDFADGVLVLEISPEFTVLTVKGRLDYMADQPVETLLEIVVTKISVPKEWKRLPRIEMYGEVNRLLHLDMLIAEKVARIYSRAIQLSKQMTGTEITAELLGV